MGSTFSKRRKKKREKRETQITESNTYEEIPYYNASSRSSSLTTVSVPDSAFSDRTFTSDSRASTIQSRSSRLKPDYPALHNPYIYDRALYSGRFSVTPVWTDDQHASCEEYGPSWDYHDAASARQGFVYEDDEVTGQYDTLPGDSRSTGTCTGTDISYMVEAFQPLMEQTINVMELLPHLHFIRAADFSTHDVQTEAVARLIVQINACEERGKWQSFLTALEEADYQYIVNLLRGETEADHTENRKLLQLFTTQIMDRLSADLATFVDHLFEKGVINERDKEEVEREKTNRGAIAGSFLLLERVPKRNPNWYDIFLDVLKDCNMADVAQMLDAPECTTSCSTKLIQRSTRTDKSKSQTRLKQRRNVNETNCKRVFSSAERKRPVVSLDSTYLTPVSDDPPPLPQRNQSRVIPYVKQNKDYISTNCRPREHHTEKQHSQEIEDLLQTKKELEVQVQERRLKRQLKVEIDSLQREIEQFTKDDQAMGENNLVHVHPPPNENVRGNEKLNDDSDIMDVESSLGFTVRLIDRSTSPFQFEAANETIGDEIGNMNEAEKCFEAKNGPADNTEVIVLWESIPDTFAAEPDGKEAYQESQTNTGENDGYANLDGDGNPSFENDENGYEVVPDGKRDLEHLKLLEKINKLLMDHKDELRTNFNQEIDGLKEHFSEEINKLTITQKKSYGDTTDDYITVETVPTKLYDVNPTGHVMLYNYFRKNPDRRPYSIDSAFIDNYIYTTPDGN